MKQSAEQVVFRFNRMVDSVRSQGPSLKEEDVETLRACADYIVQTAGWSRTDFIALLMSLDPYPRKRPLAA